MTSLSQIFQDPSEEFLLNAIQTKTLTDRCEHVTFFDPINQFPKKGIFAYLKSVR